MTSRTKKWRRERDRILRTSFTSLDEPCPKPFAAGGKSQVGGGGVGKDSSN